MRALSSLARTAHRPPPSAAGDEKITSILQYPRSSNNLKMGIVGMPNIGKSSLFNILTSSCVPAENYPFCTIDPSESRVIVPDERLDWLVDHVKPVRVVPAFLTVVDIAGLVRGAAKGEGLGNAFLATVKAADGIFHLVRAFKDQGIVHVENSVDPIRDAQIIDLELRLKDADHVSSLLSKLESKSTSSKPKDQNVDKELLRHVHDLLTTTSRPLVSEPWTLDEAHALSNLRLLSLKPMVHLINMDEQDYINYLNGGQETSVMKQLREQHGAQHIVPYSGALEGLLAEMASEEDRQSVIEDLQESFGGKNVRVESAVPRIVWAGYHAVGLNHYFTYGKEEVRAWTVRRGTRGPQAAAVIHTDFEKGFVAAEVMRFSDLRELGSEEAVRGAGRYVTRGKDAVIGDGDVVNFKINHQRR
ncbi:hypothetical protein HDU84_004439 [Entophlyctis sp. JEL0112]|nr:hypothetical protein HDU84_004439 [Entophlyctis sp. JEL0112]